MTGTLAIDTILFFVVVRPIWRKPLWVALLGAASFLFVDVAFFAANLTKVVSGGWFPLVIAALIFGVLITWRRCGCRAPRSSSTPTPRDPLALRYNVEPNRVLHENVIVCSVTTAGVPFVPEAERLEVATLVIPDDGIALARGLLRLADRGLSTGRPGPSANRTRPCA